MEIYSGYKNIAPLAEVKATKAENSASLLTDKLVRFHETEIFDEFIATGTTTITLKFDDYVKAKALLIYNSYDYKMSFYHVKSIKFSFRKTDGDDTVKGKAVIKDAYYNFDKYVDIPNETMRPGAPMVFEFEELEIDSVSIVIELPAGQEKMAISEIMLLGKEE
jgi:hypothetical protein